MTARRTILGRGGTLRGEAMGMDESRGAARPSSDVVRAKPDRRAEALRANLKRRKAQTRARDEARPDDPQGATIPDAPAGDA